MFVLNNLYSFIIFYFCKTNNDNMLIFIVFFLNRSRCIPVSVVKLSMGHIIVDHAIHITRLWNSQCT